MKRQGSRALAATITALALSAAPAGAQTAVTIEGPAGTQVVSVAQVEHWTQVNAASIGVPRSKAKSREVQAPALQLLIEHAWLTGETRERGIAVSAREVERTFRRQKRSAFKTDKDFRRFLSTTKQTLRDVRWRVRQELMAEKLSDAVTTAAAATVTDAEVETYLAQNEMPAVPELRDVRLLMTTSRAKARRVKAAIERGATFRQAARRYDVEGEPDVLTENARGGLPRKLDRAIFRAKRGELIGPVEYEGGYYVIKLLRITPARRLTPEEARTLARETLAQEAQAAALDEFMDHFRDTWRQRTVCARAYDWHRDCSNWDGTTLGDEG